MDRPRFNKVVVGMAILILVCLILYFIVKFNDPDYVEKTVRISELLSASIYLAEQAGKAVHEVRLGKNSNLSPKLKDGEGAGKEYVTEGDRRSHEIITRGLLGLWPKLAYRSEERSHPGRPTSKFFIPPLYNPEIAAVAGRNEGVNLEEVTVWIDPLDATQEYTEGDDKNRELLKYVTVMVCIVVKDVPVASVIHQPFVKGIQQEGKTYWSWVNHGTSPNLRTSRPAHAPPTTNKLKIISSRSHPGDVKKIAESAFKGISIQHITAAGSGYKSLQVAMGRADLYLHTTPIKKWDTCAGHALISAMGGAMTSQSGGRLNYNILGSPLIREGIIAVRNRKSQRSYLEKLRQ